MGDAKRSNGESSFFEELIKQDFYQGSTKTASYEGGMNKEAAKSMLEDFSADQLEALAEEFDSILGKQASSLEPTLEDSILEGEEKMAEEEEKEEPKEKKESKKEEDDEDDEEEDEEEPKEKKEKKEKKVPFFMKGKEKSEDKAESEKEAAELQEQIIKEASDKALEIMEERGLTLEDYAYSRIQNEKLASFIADKGGKLAVIMDMNPLLVIDDIVNSVEAQICEEE